MTSPQEALNHLGVERSEWKHLEEPGALRDLKEWLSDKRRSLFLTPCQVGLSPGKQVIVCQRRTVGTDERERRIGDGENEESVITSGKVFPRITEYHYHFYRTAGTVRMVLVI